MISSKTLINYGEEIYNNNGIAYYIYNRRKYKVDVLSPSECLRNIKILNSARFFEELSYLLPSEELYKLMKEHKGSIINKFGGDLRVKHKESWGERTIKKIKEYGKNGK